MILQKSGRGTEFPAEQMLDVIGRPGLGAILLQGAAGELYKR